ncbi:TIGR02679 family protein [Kumtagia ephedrae]|uniref:TIGR02679 family protein n=1 Tax=Kumtagia ephedrae TaxID=2116701 RepID=UPI001FE1B7CC|nr:TIGR02679 family protein [Mesorhizobium ephedrae]
MAGQRRRSCWPFWRHTTSPVADEGSEPLTEADPDAQLAGGAERARDTWARAGVLVNELARPALFLNLPVRNAESGRWLPGEPAYASLRSLLRSPPSWDVADRTVHVCENPNLLAIAADRLGAGCAPLVCTDGMPAAAQRCLLSQLAQAGARLRYHGDFDWPGLRIGNHFMREHGAQPWRFGAADYLSAVRTTAAQSLGGKAVEASWDGALKSPCKTSAWPSPRRPWPPPYCRTWMIDKGAFSKEDAFSAPPIGFAGGSKPWEGGAMTSKQRTGFLPKFRCPLLPPLVSAAMNRFCVLLKLRRDVAFNKFNKLHNGAL